MPRFLGTVPRPTWAKPQSTAIDVRHPLSQGLAGAITFQEGYGTALTLFGVGSGTFLTGRPNTTYLTFVGTNTFGWNSGLFADTYGNYFRFNGTDASFTSGAIMNFSILGAAFTVRLLLCSDHAPGTGSVQEPVNQLSGVGDQYFSFYWDHTAAGRVTSWRTHGTSGYNDLQYQNVTFQANTWYDLAYTYDGNANGVSQIYLNGMLNRAGTIVDMDGGTGAGFALASYDGTQQFFAGGIAGFWYWSRALGANEIASLYIDPWQIFLPQSNVMNAPGIFAIPTVPPTGGPSTVSPCLVDQSQNQWDVLTNWQAGTWF